jgi:hypothetical protein
MNRRELVGLLGAGMGFGLASALRGDLEVAAESLQSVTGTGNVAFPKGKVIRTLRQSEV